MLSTHCPDTVCIISHVTLYYIILREDSATDEHEELKYIKFSVVCSEKLLRFTLHISIDLKTLLLLLPLSDLRTSQEKRFMSK